MSEAPPAVASMRSYSDVEYVFEPHDNSLPAARKYIQAVWDRRAFIGANARSAQSGSQVGTKLGALWTILDPLVQALIYFFLFTAIRGAGQGRFLMVVSGVFMYTFTSTCLGTGGRSVLQSKGLVMNSSFPLATLPLSSVYTGLVQLGPMLAVYTLFHLVFGGAVTPLLLMLPMLFVLHLGIAVGATFIFATLVVYIRDMSNVLEYVLRVLMFMTPILWRSEDLAAIPGVVHYLLLINPFFAVFSCYQTILMGETPEISWILQSLGWAVVLPIAGFRIFTARERGFALRL